MTARPKLRAAALSALLIAMTLAAYGPALQAGYVWDDDDYVTNNPLLSEPDGLARIWFSMDAPSQYVPMVYTTLRIEYAIWALDPLGYHLVNVLLHAANALLLWLVLIRLQAPGAWLVAAVFALHPVHVESVAWISERKNVLSLLFSLASAIAWLRFVEPGVRPRRGILPAVLGLHCLALLSKASACTFPVAMLLLLWMRGQRIDRRRIAQVVPFVLVGIGMGLLIVYWERFHIGTQGERFGLSLLESALVASRACWFYLQKLVWPTQLTFSYPRFEIDSGDPLQYGWLLAGCILLWLLWREQRRIGRVPFAAALFFIATLSPMLGFIPLFTFWYTFVADHYQYAASIGPIALFVGGSASVLKKAENGPRILAGVGALLLGVLGATTFQQSRIYENRETLWRDTIAKNPSSWMAHVNLGRHLRAEQRWEDAAEAFGAALRIRPETYRAHLGLAKVMGSLGRDEDARQHYAAALAVEPNLPGAHHYLATAAWREGDTGAAIRHTEAMVLLEPRNPSGHILLGRRLERLGRHDEAWPHYERALSLDPTRLEARRGLARRQAQHQQRPGSTGVPEDDDS